MADYNNEIDAFFEKGVGALGKPRGKASVVLLSKNDVVALFNNWAEKTGPGGAWQDKEIDFVTKRNPDDPIELFRGEGKPISRETIQKALAGAGINPNTHDNYGLVIYAGPNQTVAFTGHADPVTGEHVLDKKRVLTHAYDASVNESLGQRHMRELMDGKFEEMKKPIILPKEKSSTSRKTQLGTVNEIELENPAKFDTSVTMASLADRAMRGVVVLDESNSRLPSKKAEVGSGRITS